MPVGEFTRLSYFDGAAENPLSESGKWARLDTDGSGALEKKTGGLVGKSYVASSVVGEVRDAYYVLDEYGPNAEVMIQPWTFPDNGIVDLYLVGQDEGTGNPDYYRLRVTRNPAAPDTWVISHVSNGVVTQLATTNWSVFGGDWIYFRRTGNYLEARQAYYYDDVDDESGDNLDPYTPFGNQSDIVVTATDSTITTAGIVGFGTNDLVQLRNFFAGTYVSEVIDAETINLKLTPRGREGIPGQLVQFSFEDLDQWELDPDREYSHRHFSISEKWATEGDTSLRVDHSTIYSTGDDYYLRWVAVDGTPTQMCWLAYSFYIDKWAQIWRDGADGLVILPSFLSDPDSYELDFGNLTLRADSQTTGTMTIHRLGMFSNLDISLSENTWHSIRIGLSITGDLHQVYVNNVLQVNDSVDLSAYVPSYPAGVLIRGDNSGQSGIVYYDDMRWRVGTDPGEPSRTEQKSGSTTEQ